MYVIDGKIENIIDNDKKIICFGSGKGLLKLLEEFQKYKIETKIKAVVDNNENKQGNIIKINEFKIPIISFKSFVKNYKKEYIYIITNTYLKEMIKQFSGNRDLEGIECYYYNLLICNEKNKENSSNSLECLKLTDKPIIPKKIHYCWFGKGKKSKLNERCIASWKKYCKDYEIIEWNEENYDVSKNKFMHEAYKNKSWAYVSDYVRLDILEEYGGIYLDTDVEVLQNIDELLYQKSFMGVDYSKRISLGLGFGAIPNLPEIKQLRDVYNNIKFSLENIKKRVILAPNLQKPVFKKMGYNEDGEYQLIGNITIYPPQILSALDSRIGIVLKTKNSYMAHHYEGSWTNNSEKIRRLENWKIIKEAVNKKNKKRG